MPLRDFDIWFHLKSGEVISKMGIIHHDVFSYRTAGREWFPYEWLFQVTFYAIQQIAGFNSLKYVVGGIMVIQLWFLRRILKNILSLNIWLTLTTLFIYYASIFEFVAARPHIVAYTLLIITIYLLLRYMMQNKNTLWAAIPITLVWANLHGSIFLDIALFGSFTGVTYINYYISKNKIWLAKCKTLALYTITITFCTILPPLGTTQYRLLWLFFGQRKFISSFIDEWTPLILNPIGFYIFTAFAAVVLILLLIHIIKSGWKKYLWTIPFIPLIFTAYVASRNIYIAHIALSVLLGLGLTGLMHRQLSKKAQCTAYGLICIVLALHGWVFIMKQESPTFYYPVSATNFIKKIHLSGNMYNEYAYGGYLLYQLYPDVKVFIDGRTDLYLCCEIPEGLIAGKLKTVSDDDYRDVLYQTTWDKYNISYVVIRTEKNTVLRKIARVLNTDPEWSLIFWDDYTQIFVRHDGKNDSILEKYAASAATPYLKDPYIKDQQKQAMAEYEQMNDMVKSGRTSNAIGYILLQQGQLEEARPWFEEAARLNNIFESPLMNLGELAVHDGDYRKAIEYYKKAQKMAPDRGMIYIRLGQLFIEGYNDHAKALSVWQTGVKETIDADAKKQLQLLIE